MIVIKNTQKKIPIDVNTFKQDAQKILDILDYSDFDLGIWLTTNATIKKYNHTYRNKNKPTDILSFPFYPDLKPDERIAPKFKQEENLGDIILSPEYIQKDASRWGHTFQERLVVLLVHGICHLLGYDHIDDKDYEVMRKKERAIIKKLGYEIKI